MAAGRDISDDWEEVSVGSFSIVSASSSESDDSHEALSNHGLHDNESDDENRPLAIMPSLHVPIRSTPTSPLPSLAVASEPPPRPTRGPRQHQHGGPGSQPCAASRRVDVQTCSETIARTLHDEKVARGHGSRQSPTPYEPTAVSDDCDEDILDAHADPEYLLSVLKSLGDMVQETLRYSSERVRTGGGLEERVGLMCCIIADQVDELKPIVSTYAQFWASSNTDIPLDPGLQAWLSGVRVKLLQLQVQLHTVGQEERRKPEHNDSDILACNKSCDVLMDFGRQMDDFLPIMQVDFNEFQTQQMTFPTAPRTNTSPIAIQHPNVAARSNPSSIPPPGPGRESQQLRQELYNLRDELQRCINQLSRSTSSLAPGTSSLELYVVQSYSDLFKALSLILTNHGSDWIEHGLRGGLTHAQFVRLDVETIRDIRAELTQALDSFKAASTEATSDLSPWDLRYENMPWDQRDQARSQAGQQQHGDHIFISAEVLDTLETLAEVLTATLIPSRDRSQPDTVSLGIHR